MKYPNTGPYSFCLQLSKELIHHKPTEDKLTFLIPNKSGEIFGGDTNYLKLGMVNKLYLPWKKARFIGGTNKFDLWHSTYQSTMYYPLTRRTKVVLTIHDLNFLHEHPDDIRNEKRLQLIQSRIDRADHVVCISHFCLNDIKTHLKLDKPSSVIYNGGGSIPTFITEPASLPKRPFLFALGTILPKKNFHVLPALLRGNEFDLIISGIDSFPYKKEILATAQQHNVLDRVKFTGSVTEQEKHWYYQNCNAFLFPSIAEGFGLPVIEAMAYGKPVFLSNRTSLPEVGGEHSYYFKNFNPESMQNDFLEGLNHFERTHPEEKIKKWANRFTWKNTAQSYLQLYKTVLQE